MDEIAQALTFVAFHVFVQHLVAANVIVPKLRGDALEVLVRVDLHDTLVLILDEFYQIIRTATLILCYGSVQARTIDCCAGRHRRNKIAAPAGTGATAC